MQDLFEIFNEQNSIVDYLYFIENFFNDNDFDSRDYFKWIETYDFRVIFVMNPRNENSSVDEQFRITMKSQNWIYSDSMSKILKSSLKKEDNYRDSIGSLIDNEA